MTDAVGHPERTGFSRAVALVCAVLMVVSAFPVAASLTTDEGPHLEPVDDAQPGQDSSHQVCLEDGTACAEASLHSSVFTCTGVDPISFACNVTYWLNLTVTGVGVCGNATTNATVNATPNACTSTSDPIQRVTSGPHTVRYNMTEDRRVVNVPNWVCLDNTCERWAHDPILLPSWAEWEPNAFLTGGGQFSTSHDICLGDSGAASTEGDPRPGCLGGSMISRHECWGHYSWQECELFVSMDLAPEGAGLCGSVGSHYASGLSEVTCHFENEEGVREVDSTEILSKVFPVPDGSGRTVVIEAEVCAWSFRYGAQEYCETFNHTHHLPGDEGPGTVNVIFDIIDGEIEYVAKTVEHAKPPVSVYP